MLLCHLTTVIVDGGAGDGTIETTTGGFNDAVQTVAGFGDNGRTVGDGFDRVTIDVATA